MPSNTVYKAGTDNYSSSHNLNTTIEAQSHIKEVHCSSAEKSVLLFLLLFSSLHAFVIKDQHML